MANSNKVVLVTGCSSGLGRSIMIGLAGTGHIVYAGFRKTDDLESTRKEFEKTYPNLRFLKLNVQNDVECELAVSMVLKKEKKLDVLVNNAGATIAGPIDNFTSKDYMQLLDTNAGGAFRLVRQVVPEMKKRRFGQIINITSLNGLVPLPNFSLYCSSKFALEGLGQSLAIELAPFNIRVTNVEPGAIKMMDKKTVSKLPHKPLREKFVLFKLLFPFITVEKVAQEVVRLVESNNPPRSLKLGIDTTLASFLHKYLPDKIWNDLIQQLWQR